VGLGGVLSLSCFLGEIAGRTGAWPAALRREEVELGRYGLARGRPRYDTPAVGEGVDEDETAAGLGVRAEGLGPGQAVADPCKRSVIRLILMATASQHPGVLDDFRDLVHMLRPDVGGASS
jgi:hypothetical protein